MTEHHTQETAVSDELIVVDYTDLPAVKADAYLNSPVTPTFMLVFGRPFHPTGTPQEKPDLVVHLGLRQMRALKASVDRSLALAPRAEPQPEEATREKVAPTPNEEGESAP